jgi:hypothetical protein
VGFAGLSIADEHRKPAWRVNGLQNVIVPAPQL